MIRLALLLALHLLPAPAALAQAERIVSGLSQNRVSITADFDGSEILVYGAVKRESPAPEGRMEVIVTAEGPSGPVAVWRKDRHLGIWINETAVGFETAPSFYAVATTGPLNSILSAEENLRKTITIDRVIRVEAVAAIARAAPTEADRILNAPQALSLREEEFMKALVRVRTNEGRYRMLEGTIELTDQTLFRADLTLPANLTEGIYRVRMFLLRDGKVIDEQERYIRVRKEGLERMIYNLSQQQPLLHGLLALALAAFAGWAASAVFQLIRR